jgi:2-oxoglutarate dehydrogenase E2 component (dihydrolipoamide succinyltransferase)
MKIEVKIPSPGESIEQVEIAQWLVKDGDIVEQDQTIAEMESEKATISLVAEHAGKIELLVSENAAVKVGTIACIIDTDFAEEIKKNKVDTSEQTNTKDVQTTLPPEKKISDASSKVKVSPVAQNLMNIHNITVEEVLSGSHRINRKDVEDVIFARSKKLERNETRASMSALRKKLSEKLVNVQLEAAMLTTFNEIDMSAVINLRNTYQKQFTDKYGVKLGYMSFFTKAASIALKEFPMVNAYIENDEIVTPNYTDIGIAVQTPKGLMVPVIRDVQLMDLAGCEVAIHNIADKARTNKITLDELKGGTFTITNGGVFGSLLSTPIINAPQSGILGMHAINDRPVAISGAVEIRPMMYVALSYDHRVIDGKDSVGFLKTVKQLIENPLLIVAEKSSEEQALLGI